MGVHEHPERPGNPGAARRSDGRRIASALPQGEGPERPIAISEGELVLESIGFRMALTDLYARTGLRG
jgi:hypothetical protein